MPRVQIESAKREREENDDPLVLEIDGEEFVCQDDVSDFVMMELAAAAPSGDPTEVGQAFMAFLEDVLQPEDIARFKANARKHKWGEDDILPFVQIAVEYYASRPTGPRSRSATGEPPTGTPLKVVSLSDRTVVPAGVAPDTSQTG